MKTLPLIETRLIKRTRNNGKQIKTPDDTVELVTREIQDLDRETFVVICVDSQHKPVSWERISTGSLSSSIVHPREVFKNAILQNAAAILCIHNHPSGTLEPSQDDITITQRLFKAGEILGIQLLDHIIIGSGGGSASMKADGYLY